jgi:hypothetical protein
LRYPCGRYLGGSRLVGQRGGQVYFDELAAVAEGGDAEQGARRGERWANVRGGEAVPHGRQHVWVIAHDVDHRADDVLGRRTGRGERFPGVGNDLVGLGENVAVPDDLLVAVERALAGEDGEPAGVDDRDMGVPGGLVQPPGVEADDGHRPILSEPALKTQAARGWAAGCWRARRRVMTMIIGQ